MYTELTSASRQNPGTHALPVILGLSLFALSGGTSAEGSQWAQCEPSTVNIDDVPDNVLVGTNIAESANFDDSDASLAGWPVSERVGGCDRWRHDQSRIRGTAI